MKKILLQILILVSLSSTFFNSCKKKKSDTPDPSNNANATMKCKINGVEWSASQIQATLMVVQGLGRRFDFIGTGGTERIGLSAEDASESTVMPSNVTFNQLDNDLDGEDDDVPESNALFTYAYKNNIGGFTYPFVYARGNFTITSVDLANKKVSGTFSFRTDDYDYTDPANNVSGVVIKEITEGVFTNLSYTVIE